MLYAFCHLLCLDLHPYMLICLDLHALCFAPSFILRSTSLHALCFMPCFLCLDLFFPCVVWLDSHVFMLVYMSICLSYMFYALCHIFLCFVPLLLNVNVRVTCSHTWYHVYGYALFRSTCLYACSMLLCLCLCLHMLACLNLCSSMLLRLHPHT